MSICIRHYFKPLFNEQSVNPLDCHAKQRPSIITKALRYKKKGCRSNPKEILPSAYSLVVN